MEFTFVKVFMLNGHGLLLLISVSVDLDLNGLERGVEEAFFGGQDQSEVPAQGLEPHLADLVELVGAEIKMEHIGNTYQ